MDHNRHTHFPDPTAPRRDLHLPPIFCLLYREGWGPYEGLFLFTNTAVTMYPNPKFTKTPNLFFDEHLPNMSECECKVVLAIIRKTFGWHRRSQTLSISELCKLTGLSKRGVIDGTKAALDRGVIGRTESGDSYRYWLAVKGRGVQNSHKGGGAKSSQGGVQNSHTIKDTIKEKNHHSHSDSAGEREDEGKGPPQLSGDEPWISENNQLYVEEANRLMKRYEPEDAHQVIKNQWGSGTTWAWSAITSLYRKHSWPRFVMAAVITANTSDNPSPQYMNAVLRNFEDDAAEQEGAEDEQDEDESDDPFIN